MNCDKEFYKISKYLINCIPDENLLKNYNEAIIKRKCNLNDYEKKVWKRMMKSNILFGLYDSGFSLIDPYSNIRKRIIIALAILESNNQFHTFFLNEKPLYNDFLKLIYKLPVSILQTLLGAFLVKFKI